MVGWTRSGIVLVFAACFGFLILPGWTCSAAEEVKFRNVPFCDSLCAKYRVVFLLYLSGQTTETNFSLALNFIAHEIMACHESGATYYVEIYASGSNEWRTCCNLIDCAAQLALLRFNQTINSNITASQDEILVDHYDQYQMDLVLTETINNVKPWRYQKYVYLVADYGSDMVKKDQKRLNESAILNRIALRSFIIESENFHKREILEYFQSIGATPQKNFSQLVKSAEVVKVCGKQIRQAEFKYPAQCLESSTTSANTISTTTNTMTHNYNPSTPQARHQPHIGTKMTDTLINGALTTSQQSLIDRNQSLTSGVPLTHATQTTITDPFTQDLWIFIALSERANESDYQFVLNMTAEWILTQCNPQTNGSVFVFMPRSTTVTICSWSNTSQCISQLMNTSYETAIIEVDVIIENDIDFAPDIEFYLRKLSYEENKNHHQIMLLLTDFISKTLVDNKYLFTDAREHQDLILNIMVVLDSPSRLNRSQVTSMYEELHANTILTPSSFNELPSIPSPATPCRPSTVPTLPSSPESHPSHNTSATEDPDSCEIMVALLISCSAGDDNLEKVKNFVKGNIINCMKDTDEEGAKGLYMYYPGVALDSSAICTDFDCVDGALSQMKLESSCIVTPENTNDVDDNDAYTELAVSIGFTKLLKNHPQNDNSADENNWSPALLIISDYISTGFANTFDNNADFRRNLSHLEFRMIIINASIDYYKEKSSIPNGDLYRYDSFDAMIGKDTKLCPAPAKGGLSAIAIAAIIVAAVALLIIALGVIFIIYYKNKHLDWRKKIMQFSNSDSNRTPSTTFEDLPASTASSLAGTINTARRISGLPAMFTEKRNSATPSTLTSRRKSGVLFPSWLQNPSAIRTVSQQVGLEMVMETDLWEMPRDQVIVKRDIKLGNGVYGEVFKGVIIGKAPIEEVYKTAFFAHQYDDCECAVKMLHSYAEANSRAEFLQEIGFMKELGFHPNIANMLGCITVSTPMCLLLEYAHYGDMARFLRERKDRVTTAPRLSSPAERAASNDDSVSIKDLLSFCWQISDGMEYLTELGFVHRDLAARNVLVDKAMNAMIGDFGLCRKADNVAFTSKAGRLPIKWMAIESLKSYQFSTKSDVWSFGVLMFEIFSMGMVPYIDVPQTEMLSYLCAGKRLPRPKNASLDIYDIMQSCWKERAADRPSFNSLRERLARHLEDATEDYGYLNLSQVPTGSRTSTVSDAEL